MYRENEKQKHTVRKEINEESEENGRDQEKEKKDYESDKYISGPRRVQDGTVPMNILSFQYPFNISITIFFLNIYYTI